MRRAAVAFRRYFASRGKRRSSLKQAGDAIGARVASSAADAARGADIIVSAVTAASSLEAARSVAPHLTGNPYFLDINSVSPGRKKETEKLLGGKARYVDVAILAPIHPARHQTPLLLAGPHAETVMPLLIDELEMRGAIAGDEVGQAAGLKMIRSVMIKGIEALTLECFLAAKRYGIVDEVAASLKNNYPTLDWNKAIEYNIERMASHGVRRADEMDQVAATLRELGIDPLMASATSTRQREMGLIGKEPAFFPLTQLRSLKKLFQAISSRATTAQPFDPPQPPAGVRLRAPCPATSRTQP